MSAYFAFALSRRAKTAPGSRTSLPPVMATSVPSGRCARVSRSFLARMKSARVDGRRGELAGLAGVAAAARTPSVAGLGAVGLRRGVAQGLEGVAPVAEVLRPVGDQLQLAGLDLGDGKARCGIGPEFARTGVAFPGAGGGKAAAVAAGGVVRAADEGAVAAEPELQPPLRAGRAPPPAGTGTEQEPVEARLDRRQHRRPLQRAGLFERRAEAAPEPLQHPTPGERAAGDAVEVLLHRRREAGLHPAAEERLQERGSRPGRVRSARSAVRAGSRSRAPAARRRSPPRSRAGRCRARPAGAPARPRCSAAAAA